MDFSIFNYFNPLKEDIFQFILLSFIQKYSLLQQKKEK